MTTIKAYDWAAELIGQADKAMSRAILGAELSDRSQQLRLGWHSVEQLCQTVYELLPSVRGVHVVRSLEYTSQTISDKLPERPNVVRAETCYTVVLDLAPDVTDVTMFALENSLNDKKPLCTPNVHVVRGEYRNMVDPRSKECELTLAACSHEAQIAVRLAMCHGAILRALVYEQRIVLVQLLKDEINQPGSMMHTGFTRNVPIPGTEDSLYTYPAPVPL